MNMETNNLESAPEILPAEGFFAAIEEDVLDNNIEVKNPKTKRKLFKALCMGVAATTLGLVINHVYQHRDKVEQEGENFTHSDKETEHILNVLCGKEEFTEKEKMFIYKHITLKFCRDNDIQIPENLDTWSISEFIEFGKNTKDPGLGRSQIEEFDEVVSSRFFMKNLHDVLWKFEKDYGSPKIRWSTPEQNIFLNVKHHRSNYNPITNTVNLATDDVVLDFYENFISEIAHAKQFHEKPVSSYVLGAIDASKTLYSSIVSGNDFDKEYFKLYSQEGTLEYDAHKVLEKPLKIEAGMAMGQDYEDHYEETKNKQE